MDSPNVALAFSLPLNGIHTEIIKYKTEVEKLTSLKEEFEKQKLTLSHREEQLELKDVKIDTLETVRIN